MMTDIEYWIWMSLNFGMRHELCAKLLEEYGDPVSIYDSGSELYEFAASQGVRQGEGNMRGLRIDFELDEAVAIAEYCERNSVGIVVRGEDRFPSRLKRIKDCPLLLYYRGELPALDDRLCIASVGTRRMTEYGERAAYTIAHDLARSGAVIVSGMALGVDGVSHRAALDAGGLTVAVLGCGVDRVYPSAHSELMSEIIRRGCVISEYKPGTPPEGRNFPVRNRIISGLCQATFVAEANSTSGSLITARDALWQGRDLFALPGSVGEQNSSGTNELIKSGAKMATNAGDILCEYEAEHPELMEAYLSRGGTHSSPTFRRPARQESPKNENAAEKASVRSDIRRNTKPSDTPASGKPAAEAEPAAKPEKEKRSDSARTDAALNSEAIGKSERRVYEFIAENPECPSDRIISELAMSASEAMTAITMLEIQGLIESMPGGRYRTAK